MKHPVDQVADAAKHVVDDVRDSVNEGRHRSEAELERDRRETAGDVMTPGEKAGSIVNEGKNRVLAEADKTKREVRDSN